MIEKSETKRFLSFLISIVIFALVYGPISNIIDNNFVTDNAKLIAGGVLIFILAYINRLDKFL
jgi:hypothetical protein